MKAYLLINTYIEGLEPPTINYLYVYKTYEEALENLNNELDAIIQDYNDGNIDDYLICNKEKGKEEVSVYDYEYNVFQTLKIERIEL